MGRVTTRHGSQRRRSIDGPTGSRASIGRRPGPLIPSTMVSPLVGTLPAQSRANWPSTRSLGWQLEPRISNIMIHYSHAHQTPTQHTRGWCDHTHEVWWPNSQRSLRNHDRRVLQASRGAPYRAQGGPRDLGQPRHAKGAWWKAPGVVCGCRFAVRTGGCGPDLEVCSESQAYREMRCPLRSGF